MFSKIASITLPIFTLVLVGPSPKSKAHDFGRGIVGLRLLPGNFMVIQQAMAVPVDRSDGALAVVRDFVEDMKASGFVAQALERHGITGARVAPPLNS